MDPGEEQVVFEIGLVIPKRSVESEGDSDAIKVLVDAFSNAGLVADRVTGVAEVFIKLAAPLEALGKAAANLQIKKRTRIGIDLPFDWDQVEAFARQGDGSLFSWCERYRCYHYLLYGIVNDSRSAIALKFDGMEFCWEPHEPLLQKLELNGIVKQVYPLHDEVKKKQLLRSWALNWWDLTKQPIDDVYLYFGTKIATYFAFLGMYTQWLLFPAALGIIIQIIDFGPLQYLVLPIFFICVTSWAVFFFQFWKRKNFALLTRWHISYITGTGPGFKIVGEWEPLRYPEELAKKLHSDKILEKEIYQKFEWLGRLMKFRNDAIILLSIFCLQLPFELAYAHLYSSLTSDILKFSLTAGYLVIIQYFTTIGGRISVSLIQDENNENREYRADSLVYKVFGVYFMQTYIGLFYHALMFRNIKTLRQIVIWRLIVSEVFDNLVENFVPYLQYKVKKYKAVRQQENGLSKEKVRIALRVEKEFLKPSYAASIGGGLEDGLFDDFLELALQFGMIMMFACAFPPAFAFAAVFLIVMSICTNCILLVCLYDAEGKWRMEPGLVAILAMEHVLLLIKFGFSRFVPEEPAWVRANRLKNLNHTKDVSKCLLRSISSKEVPAETKSRRIAKEFTV
ncbi:hypothetical protein V2J09_011159 [Rumex salicifolius]